MAVAPIGFSIVMRLEMPSSPGAGGARAPRLGDGGGGMGGGGM
jgi:hypothetical protein